MLQELFQPSIVGFLVFALVKLVGYSFLVQRLHRDYQIDRLSFFPAVFRAVIGMVSGLLFMFIWTRLADLPALSLAYPICLLPIRLGNWALTARLLYDRDHRESGFMRAMILKGTILSIVLDVPAGLGFLLTSEISFC